MFITHPRLVTAYALGALGLVTAHVFVSHWCDTNTLDKKHTHENVMLDKNTQMLYATHAHEKHMLDTKNTHEKYMVETTNTHEIYMLKYNRWWRRIF